MNRYDDDPDVRADAILRMAIGSEDVPRCPTCKRSARMAEDDHPRGVWFVCPRRHRWLIPAKP